MARCRQRGMGPLDSNQIITALQSKPPLLQRNIQNGRPHCLIYACDKIFRIEEVFMSLYMPIDFRITLLVVTEDSLYFKQCP